MSKWEREQTLADQASDRLDDFKLGWRGKRKERRKRREKRKRKKKRKKKEKRGTD